MECSSGNKSIYIIRFISFHQTNPMISFENLWEGLGGLVCLWRPNPQNQQRPAQTAIIRDGQIQGILSTRIRKRENLRAESWIWSWKQATFTHDPLLPNGLNDDFYMNIFTSIHLHLYILVISLEVYTGIRTASHENQIHMNKSIWSKMQCCLMYGLWCLWSLPPSVCRCTCCELPTSLPDLPPWQPTAVTNSIQLC